MNYEDLFVCCVFAIFVLLFILLTRSNRICYLNSNYKTNKNGFIIELRVDKVERVLTREDLNYCAKYTMEVYYLSSKNKVKSSTLVMFDETDKYHVGDIIVLNKKDGN